MNIDILKNIYEKYTQNNKKDMNILDIAATNSYIIPTPENGYINNQEVSTLEKIRLLYIIQDIAYEYMKQYSNIHASDIVKHMVKVGVPMDVLQLVTGLTEASISQLIKGHTFPYIYKAYQAVFDDLETKIADRRRFRFGNMTGEDINNMNSFCNIDDIRYIYDNREEDMDTVADVIKYLYASGVDIGILTNLLHTSVDTLQDIIHHNVPVSKVHITGINRILQETFTE